MCNEDEVNLIKNLIKSYRKSIPKLQILVFGPGENNPDEYAKKCFEKRLEVKKRLNDSHTVIFPEAAFNEAELEGVGVKPIIIFEKHLIEQSDCAIFISCPNCPGVEHEISTFATDPDCVNKMFLVYSNDHKYDSGWVLEDWLSLIKGGGGRIDDFCEEDLDECNVRKKIEEEIQIIATFCSAYPYKKYGGIDNSN